MAVLVRKPMETDEERRRKWLLSPDPPPQPIDSPPTDLLDTAPMTRAAKPLDYVPPEPYVIYNNKGRPTGAGGGLSALSRNQTLLEAQQSYKPQGSTKNLILQLGLGFLRGGLPGLAGGGLQYALDPGAIDRAQMERAMGHTEDAINLDLNRQRIDSQMMAQQAQLAALQRKPLEDERDNLRQLYNSQPYFDPTRNSQHKAMADRAAKLGMVLPSRDEKDDSQLEWVNGSLQRISRSGRKPVENTGLTRQSEVPVVEDGLTVTPGQALNYRGQVAQREASRMDLVGQREATSNAANARTQEAQSAADAYQKQLDDLDKSAASITTYEPATMIDKQTGTQVVLKNPDGGVAYTNKKSAERLQYEQQRKELETKRDNALADARRAQSEARSTYVPPMRRAQGQYVGQRISADKIPEAARRLNMTTEQARQYLVNEGAVIY